jgi:hypothetical protein
VSQNAAGSLLASCIRNRVGSFDYLDSLAMFAAVSVPGDNQTLKRLRCWPVLLDRFGHCRGRLARTNDNGPALWRRWQVRRQAKRW